MICLVDVVVDAAADAVADAVAAIKIKNQLLIYIKKLLYLSNFFCFTTNVNLIYFIIYYHRITE